MLLLIPIENGDVPTRILIFLVVDEQKLFEMFEMIFNGNVLQYTNNRIIVQFSRRKRENVISKPK